MWGGGGGGVGVVCQLPYRFCTLPCLLAPFAHWDNRRYMTRISRAPERLCNWLKGADRCVLPTVVLVVFTVQLKSHVMRS